MKSFAELIDYDAEFKELAAKGILFSDADKKKFRDICDEELKKYDGNAIIGTNLGASATDWVYKLFSFLQNIFRGFDFHHIGDSVSHAAGTTSAQSQLYTLGQASMHIHERFEQEGGNFLNAADYVCGQKRVTATDHSAPELLENSIYCQIRKTIDLPWGTSSNLNRTRT